jgi:hypothetical protein
MDFIVDLAMSNGFNAVWVVVKHPTFIPTTMGLDAEGFSELFVKHIASYFSLPYSIIADRNLCWTFDFWKAVSKFLKTRMLLSSSHHPQHDGQTEILNRNLETLMHAYVANDQNSWADLDPSIGICIQLQPAWI